MVPRASCAGDVRAPLKAAATISGSPFCVFCRLLPVKVIGMNDRRPQAPGPDRGRPARGAARPCACCSRPRASTPRPPPPRRRSSRPSTSRDFDVGADGPQLHPRHHLRPRGARPAAAAAGRSTTTLPVVVMTAWASVDVAVEAMRRGARDFVEKPWDNARLLAILRNQVDLRRALRRGERLEAENELLRATAASPADRRVARDAAGARADRARRPVGGQRPRSPARTAPARASWRRAAPRRLGPRRRAAWSRSTPAASPRRSSRASCSATCAAPSPTPRPTASGRFELADGGTLFLDEIANISLSQQAKLLRVLETGEFERLGSSQTRTRRRAHPLGHQRRPARGGRRRPLPPGPPLPPEHGRDPPPAAARPPGGHPAARPPLPGDQHAQRYRKSFRGFEEPAPSALLAHPWPGNVRELDHAVERGVLMGRGDSTAARVDLGLPGRPATARAAAPPRGPAARGGRAGPDPEGARPLRRTSARRPRRSASRAAPSTAGSRSMASEPPGAPGRGRARSRPPGRAPAQLAADRALAFEDRVLLSRWRPACPAPARPALRLARPALA